MTHAPLDDLGMRSDLVGSEAEDLEPFEAGGSTESDVTLSCRSESGQLGGGRCNKGLTLLEDFAEINFDARKSLTLRLVDAARNHDRVSSSSAKVGGAQTHDIAQALCNEEQGGCQQRYSTL